jgi:hypothetical protein
MAHNCASIFPHFVTILQYPGLFCPRRQSTKGDDVGTAGKYSFEVGPSIFEGLDKPSLNPLRILMDMLGEEMPVKTYTGLGYWTPEGYW